MEATEREVQGADEDQMQISEDGNDTEELSMDPKNQGS